MRIKGWIGVTAAVGLLVAGCSSSSTSTESSPPASAAPAATRAATPLPGGRGVSAKRISFVPKIILPPSGMIHPGASVLFK